MSTVLFNAVKTAQQITDRVLVFVSGGKDSVAALDLCSQYFEKIDVCFMFLVPGLSFNQSMKSWIEKRYGVQIIQVPHFMISEWLRYGLFRGIDLTVPIVKIKQVYDYVREITGTYWIVTGERIADSVVRAAYIKKSGSIDSERGKIYPLAHWKVKNVNDYIRIKRLKISPESAILGHSFRSFMPKEIFLIKQHYPEDYEKIRAEYPLIDTSLKQYEFFHHEKEAAST